MDEITLFASLRPAAPPNAEQLTEAARGRLATAFGDAARQPARPGRGRRSRPRRRTMLLAAAAIAVMAVGAIVAPAILLGGSGGPLVTAAWAIQRNPDGTIKVTMKQARDAAGLQQTLRADGIRAYVRYITWLTTKHGNVTTGEPAESCQQAGAGDVPARVGAGVFPFPAGGGPDQGYAVTINPAAIPPGDAILIQVTWGGGVGGMGIAVQDRVLGNTSPPVCTPSRIG